MFYAIESRSKSAIWSNNSKFYLNGTLHGFDTKKERDEWVSDEPMGMHRRSVKRKSEEYSLGKHRIEIH